MSSPDLIDTFAQQVADEMSERDYGNVSCGNGVLTLHGAWYRTAAGKPAQVHVEIVRATENGEAASEVEFALAPDSDAREVVLDRTTKLAAAQS